MGVCIDNLTGGRPASFLPSCADLFIAVRFNFETGSMPPGETISAPPLSSCPDLFRASTSGRRFIPSRRAPRCRETWMAGTSPAMTVGDDNGGTGAATERRRDARPRLSPERSPLTLTLSPPGRGDSPPPLPCLLPSRLREGPGEGRSGRKMPRTGQQWNRPGHDDKAGAVPIADPRQPTARRVIHMSARK